MAGFKNGAIEINDQVSPPETPPAGYMYLFGLTDGSIQYKHPNGTIKELTNFGLESSVMALSGKVDVISGGAFNQATTMSNTLSVSGALTVNGPIVANNVVGIVSNGLTIGPTANTAGSIFISSSGGLSLREQTGSSFDFKLVNPGNTANIIVVPTGTSNVVLADALNVSGAITGGANITSLNGSTIGITDSNMTLRVGSGNPQAVWVNANATTDQKVWQIVSSATAFNFRTVNDAVNTVYNWMSANRNGNSVYSVAISADTNINGSTLINSTLQTVGNVGIGTAPTSYKVNIVTSGNNGLLVDNGSRQIYVGATGGEAAVGTLTNHELDIISNGSTRIKVAADGGITIPNTVSISGDTTIDGVLTVDASAVVYNTIPTLIRSNTSDGNDTSLLRLCGGATASTTRGALIDIAGNEHSSIPGQLRLFAGDTGFIRIASDVYVTDTKHVIVGGPSTGTLDADFTSPFGTPYIASIGSGNSAYHFVGLSNVNTSVGAAFVGAHTRSTGTDANTIVQNADELMHIGAWGADGASFREAGNITFEVDGTPGSSDMPGRIVFRTATDGGITLTERMRIDNAGLVTIASTSPSASTLCGSALHAGILLGNHANIFQADLASSATDSRIGFSPKGSTTTAGLRFICNSTTTSYIEACTFDAGGSFAAAKILNLNPIGGAVVVGATDPGGSGGLRISGGVNASGPIVLSTASGTGVTVAGATDATFGHTGAFSLHLQTNGVDAITIDSSRKLTIGAGFNQGSGLKHIRQTTGSISGLSSGLVTVTWANAFADANYTVCASVEDSTTNTASLSVYHIETISASAVAIRVQNEAVGAKTGTLHVIAIHD